MLIEKSDEVLINLVKKWRTYIESQSIYGFGFSEFYFIKNFLPEEQKFAVQGIYDNDPQKQNTVQMGYRIHSPDLLRQQKTKILILSKGYLEIKKQLIKYGLEEYEDFISYYDLLVLLHWFVYDKVFLPEIHIAVTTKCSLKCKDCNMMMPLYSNPNHIDIMQLKKDVDILFTHVDFIQNYMVLGGEPLLHTKLEEYLDYVGEKYNHRIGQIFLTTNGTLHLSLDMAEICKKHNVHYAISDYTASNSWLNGQLSSFMSSLEEHSILFSISSMDHWTQFYTDSDIFMNMTEPELTHHYRQCLPVFKGFQNGKFYPCHITWSAEQCGIHNNDEGDYLDFRHLTPSKSDRKKIIWYNLGFCAKGYLTFCTKCYGCNSQYSQAVQAAEQQNNSV